METFYREILTKIKVFLINGAEMPIRLPHGNSSIAKFCGIRFRCVVQEDFPLAEKNYLQQTC